MLPLVISAALAAEVGVALPTDKVRPSFPTPAVDVAVLDAARGEVEPFQIVIRAGDVAVEDVVARASDLVGPDGAVLPASDVVLHRVGLIEVTTPSSAGGALGPWPDPLIPDVDVVVGERRAAFPFSVPAGEARAVWVDVRVAATVPPGVYRGSVDLGALGQVPITLRVHDVVLPATSTLVTAFGTGGDHPCLAHLGSLEACGAAGCEAYNTLYAAFALDYRVSLSGLVFDGPDGSDWPRFDGLYGPLLDGTADTWLPGARLTALQLKAQDPAAIAAWGAHFARKGWLDRLFQFTCDEPPAGCSWDDIPARAAAAHAAGIRSAVSTDLAGLTAHGLTDVVDVAVPVINAVDEKGGPDLRGDYDAFLARPGTSLWWYQSCQSHGCDDAPTTWSSGWPSRVIDATGVQNRAMPWLAFRDRIAGELYYAVDYALPTAWTDSYAFGGNGDGTLFYPGLPTRIGGQTDIPVASQRLALVREGLEDHELLVALAARGGEDAAFAEALARDLFPEAATVDEVDGATLMAARHALLVRLAPLPGEEGDGPDARCGCRTAPSGAAWLPWVALLGWRRRRREPTPTRRSRGA